MSDILEFIVKNFQRLQAADYALLLVFAALVGGALFAGFRWIFAARYQAQKELLDIQRQTVDTLSSHLDFAKKERDDLRRELDERMRRLREFEAQGQSTVKEQYSLREETLGIVATHIILLLERLVISYRFLVLHKHAGKQPMPTTVIRVVETLNAHIERLLTMYQKTYAEPNRKSLPALVAMLNSDEIGQIAGQVYKWFMDISSAIQEGMPGESDTGG